MPEKAQSSRPKTVAVVGTGMAGLTTAHLLHQDPKNRYKVTLLEKQDKISLSAESVAFPSRDEKNRPVWADVPMRAFAGGFYNNLIRMYDYLGVAYHEQPFMFSFTRLPRLQQSPLTTSCIPGPRMVYASNFHQIPPIPRTVDLINWLVEAVYAVFCYLWFTLCCFFIAPHPEDTLTQTPSESLDHYLNRIWIPHYYVTTYLLPLISSVCTCSHEELLRFPASDVLEYKRQTHRQQHFVVTDGVHYVQEKLLENLDVRLSVQITNVKPEKDGVQIEYTSSDGSVSSQKFDLVVLAVSPDIAATLLPSLNSQLSTIPTTTVETIAHTDDSAIMATLKAAAFSNSAKRAQPLGTQGIHFFSNGSITEAVHEQGHDIFVTTNPLLPMQKSKILRSASFTRVLRSPRSRLAVNTIFQEKSQTPNAPPSWRNGDDGIFLAGGWCWDGMVLLEGCIVSAMRVAAELDVAVPWQETE